MASSTLIRPGKCRPDTNFLRQFPGKRRFQRVSESDWNAPLPPMDIAGFGQIIQLEADVRVMSPRGDLQVARKWPSRSYIRNFARLLRNLFGQTVQLVDIAAVARTTLMNTNAGVSGAGLTAGLNFTVSQAGNPENAGLGFAIGQGVPLEDHLRNDLVSRVGPIVSSRNNVRTTVLDAATTTLEVTTGITNGQAAPIGVTEIGLYLYAMQLNASFDAVPFITLIAYDGIVSVPVASGGVIAPRYTMNFPV